MSSQVLKSKGSCLICLKRVFNQTEKSKESNLAIDLKGDQELVKSSWCQPDLSNENVHENSKTKLLLLHSVSRYLKIDYSGVFKEKRGTIPAELCEKCLKIADQFVKVYKMYDDARLQLNRFMRIMYDKIKEAQSRNHGNDDNADNISEVENVMWRDLVVEKLSKRMKEDLPKIRIQDIRLLQDPSSIDSYSDSEIHGVDSPDPDVMPPDSVVTIDPETNQKSCQYCGIVIPSFRKYKYRRHIVRYHTETFFSFLKNSSISDSQFKKIVDSFLFDDIKKKKACPHCPFSISVTDDVKVKLRLHLIDEHFSVLKRKLKSLQENPKRDKEKRSRVSMKKKSALKSEKVLKTSQKPKTSSVADNFHKLFVKNLMKAQKERVDLKAITRSRSITKSLEESPKNDNELREIKVEPMEVDAVEQNENDATEMHLDHSPFDDMNEEENASFHHSNLSSASGESQPNYNRNSPLPSSCLPPIQPSTLTSQSTSNAEADQLPQSGETKSKKRCCPYCPFVLFNYSFRHYKYRRHRLRRHAETFFSSLKLSNISDDHFQKIVKRLLFKEFKKLEICPFCQKYIGPQAKELDIHLRLHLIDEHFDKMKEKLLDIQSDPGLEDILRPFCKPKRWRPGQPKPIKVKKERPNPIFQYTSVVCEICGKAVRKANYRDHKVLHEDDQVKETTCDHCGKELKTVSMRFHRMYECPKGAKRRRFRPKKMCEGCGKVLSNGTYRKHKLYHCNAVKSEDIKAPKKMCEGCGKLVGSGYYRKHTRLCDKAKSMNDLEIKHEGDVCVPQL